MRKIIGALALLLVIGIAVAWVVTSPRLATSATIAVTEPGGNADHGRIIFVAGGCASCHATPGQDDRTKLGGGLELKSPFGTFVAPNISPDPNDGIGRWTLADFVNAVQAGVSPGGEHYYPAFPYTTYAHARHEDMRDLFAYLRTLPEVSGKPPPHKLSFPYSVRRAVGLWKLVNMDQRTIANDPEKSPEWNRGHYLVEALGHCAECHSPRDALGGIRSAQRYAGGPDLEGDGWVPNITQASDGIADWSVKDIAYLLETGETPDGDSVDGSMRDVVRNTRDLSNADRMAISTYIKSLPPRQGPPAPKRKD